LNGKPSNTKLRAGPSRSGRPGRPRRLARSLATMREICSSIKLLNYGSNITVRQYFICMAWRCINIMLMIGPRHGRFDQ
jgi:hypothetical protein